MSQTPQTKEKKTNVDTKQKVMTIVGTLLCIILLPVLVINVTLIVKSYVNTDEVPTLGGYCPMIVLTDSMFPVIEKGDLIICRTIDADKVKVGDVISFFDPASSKSSVVTHRVLEVINEGGKLSFKTKGDYNNTEDRLPVPAENLVGIYQTRIGGAGNVAMFLQTTPGLIICVVCPVVLLVGYDMLRRKKYDTAKQADTDALLAELEALRAEKAAKETAGKTDDAQ